MNTNENYSEVYDLNATSTFKADCFPIDMYVIFNDDDEIYSCSIINRDDHEDGKSVLYIFGLAEDVVKAKVNFADLDQSSIHYPTIHLFLEEEEAKEWQNSHT